MNVAAVSVRSGEALPRHRGRRADRAMLPGRTGVCASRPSTRLSAAASNAMRDAPQGTRRSSSHSSRSSHTHFVEQHGHLCLTLPMVPGEAEHRRQRSRELAKKFPGFQICKPAARVTYSGYRQANTGCSSSSTASWRPSNPNQRSCNSTAPVGAWMRSLPSGIWTTGRALSGIVMNRGESSRCS